MATRLLKILFEFFYLYVLYALLRTLAASRCHCRQQCCHNNHDDDGDDDVCRVAIPPLPPAPSHKSKEQIAAAKPVKANKPKCRRNKLANVMSATGRRVLHAEGGGGVVLAASEVVLLYTCSCAKMEMKMANGEEEGKSGQR